MRAKCHSFLSHLPQIAEAENLKSAGVGQVGPPPRHEPVQAAQLAYLLNPRPQIQVVSVPEKNLDAQFFQQILRNALHGGLRANRHEYGGFNCAVRRG